MVVGVGVGVVVVVDVETEDEVCRWLLEDSGEGSYPQTCYSLECMFLPC